MLNVIYNNPYRIVGVYATSTKKEIVANIARIKANLRVNRQISFQSDLDSILQGLERTADSITEAESKLTLPKDIIGYAQFWFINETELDKIAIDNLTVGSIDKAISIWDKQENLSSVHNRILSYLINGNYDKAVEMAFLFYGKYAKDFINRILGNESQIVSVKNIEFNFLDILCDEIGASELSLYITNREWGVYVGNKIVDPIINSINHSISIAKETKGKGANERLGAGTKLMTDSLTLLQKLKSELSISDPKYQIIADKLGLEILQCGIDYYKGTEDVDAAYKTMKLLKYAQSIVVGKMAKDRCDENIAELEKIISQLPPIEVIANDKAIKEYLSLFANQPNLICNSISLIKSTVPHIVAIKEKLGNFHKYYLRISTRVVNNALGKIIAEVNNTQKKDFYTLKNTLISAWRAQLYLDKFDLEPEYKDGRYKQCRASLYKLINDYKGFDESMMSFMYQYGCGWCNDIDVSDVDLRTDDEFYISCRNIDSFIAYLKRFPNGKHVLGAKSNIETLKFYNAKTIADLEKFIQQFPNSRYVSQAKEKIIDLRFKECKSVSDYQKFLTDFPSSSFVVQANEAITKIVKQEKYFSLCISTNDVIALYNREERNGIDIEKCSLRAFELAKNEDDYHNVISTFGVLTSGGKKAKEKIIEKERRRKEKEEKRKNLLKKALWIGGSILILLAIGLIWGVRGFSIVCGIIAFISSLIAFGTLYGKNNGCGTFFICVAIAVVFALTASFLSEWADDDIADDIEKIEIEEESFSFFEKIINSPNEKDCAKFIQEYFDTENADSVRNIWLNLILEDAKVYDFYEHNQTSYFSNPVKRLQYYINKNENTSYSEKAQNAMGQICDSLYDIANTISTIEMWKKYQKLVPTDYYKDSEKKIEEIENQAWNTEPKAWQIASSENSISAYAKYKYLYPQGSHINLCEKKLIDLEVSLVYASEHGTLPKMDRTGYGEGPTSYIKVTNSTSYTLTLLYSGPDSKRLVLLAGGTSSIRLKNGNYRVAAFVSASNISNYVCNENLQGGNYSVDYYISSHRY